MWLALLRFLLNCDVRCCSNDFHTNAATAAAAAAGDVVALRLNGRQYRGGTATTTAAARSPGVPWQSFRFLGVELVCASRFFE